MMRTDNSILFRILSNRVYFLIALMIVVVVVMSLLSPFFLTVSNLLGMTRFGAVLALLALGQTLVILAGNGGIDLSVGAMVSLAGVIFGLLVTQYGVNVWVATFLIVFVGAGLGAINGLIISYVGVPPLIGTLGMQWAYGAIALVLTAGRPLSGFPADFGFIGAGRILEIPAMIVLFVVPVFLVLQFVLIRTVLGRWITLIGVNDRAARFSGIPVKRTRFLLYTLNGVLAALGAIIMSSWLMSARPDAGMGLELQSITVSVLGGTSIFGGVASLPGTLLAVLIVTMVASGLQLANINAVWQLAVLGFILLLAVALNQWVVRRVARRQGLRV
jgi:ribose/xylose/arabinose/galactoside ABC-type transport system permease subunit